MKIAFYSAHLGLRGTEVTMYDYARYSEELLGNESIIIYHKNHFRNNQSVIEKFSNRFKVYPIDDFEYDVDNVNRTAPGLVLKLEEVMDKESCDAIYMQKGGFNDGVFSKRFKTLVLCCTMVDPRKEKHGDRYAFISNWLSRVCSNGETPVVPSMVTLPNVEEDLRSELNIPKEAIVFGRTGGEDTWNLPFTNQVIQILLQRRKDIYFLFQSTPKFIDHPNVIHIPSGADVIYKTKFINTTDAMIHSRHEGESFGVACGEFSIRNKPVITWSLSKERNHIEILGNKGIYYDTPQSLYDTLMSFEKRPDEDWNCYRDYSPEKVMKKFKDIFLNDL